MQTLSGAYVKEHYEKNRIRTYRGHSAGFGIILISSVSLPGTHDGSINGPLRRDHRSVSPPSSRLHSAYRCVPWSAWPPRGEEGSYLPLNSLFIQRARIVTASFGRPLCFCGLSDARLAARNLEPICIRDQLPPFSSALLAATMNQKSSPRDKSPNARSRNLDETAKRPNWSEWETLSRW
jgi:hypothetical protein